jgi:predicted nucleic acid binding AN1-type Zn finger protein
MKCDLCNKKVVIAITCQCSKIYCIKHRMPEDHECTFDFKEKTRMILSKQIPIVSDKLQNRI